MNVLIGPSTRFACEISHSDSRVSFLALRPTHEPLVEDEPLFHLGPGVGVRM